MKLEYEYLGKQTVKNISEPAPYYRILSLLKSAIRAGVQEEQAYSSSDKSSVVVLPFINMSNRGNIEIARDGDENVINYATTQNGSIVPLMNQEGDYLPEKFTIEFDTYFSEFCKKYNVSFWDMIS